MKPVHSKIIPNSQSPHVHCDLHWNGIYGIRLAFKMFCTLYQINITTQKKHTLNSTYAMHNFKIKCSQYAVSLYLIDKLLTRYKKNEM